MLIFFLRVTHTYNARVAQWWSTSLPRRGPRVRSPSRAFLMQKNSILKWCCFFALNEPNPGLEGSKSRLPARSLLLQSRVIHRMTATRLALFIKKNLKGCCFCIKRAYVLCSKVRSLACRLGGCSCVKWYF